MDQEKTVMYIIVAFVGAFALAGTILSLSGNASGLAWWRIERTSQQADNSCYVYTNCHVYRLTGGYQTALNGLLQSSCLAYDDIANTARCSHLRDGTPCEYDKQTGKNCLYP